MVTQMEGIMKLLVGGGGTAGHLYPGVAVAEKAKEKGVKSFFLVSDRGIERKILTSSGYEFYEQPSVPMKGMGMMRKIKSLALVTRESFKVAKMIEKGDKILLTGGFAAAAPAIAAILKRADLYIHEQNSVMGFTNRKFAGFCKKVFLSFDETVNSKGDTVVVGNPVRKIFDGKLSKDKSGKKILVLGGSQGSRFINGLVSDTAKKLVNAGYTLVHQTGGGLYEETLDMYRANGVELNDSIRVVQYIDDIAMAYETADMVIARAGSGTVFESMYSKRPAIYIPLPSSADNHQYFNAKYAENKGIAKILEQKNASPSALLRMVTRIDEDFKEIKANMDKIHFLDSASLIAGGMNIG